MRSLLLAFLVVTLIPACTTRISSTTFINERGLEIRLRTQKPAFGFRSIKRGFNQPVDISPARLEAILSGIQIDERPSRKSTIRERRYAIPRKIIPKIAEGLSRAYAKANPNQEIAVLALQKKMHNFVFTRKFLTSFVTWVEGDELIIDLSRLEWETGPSRAKDKMEPARYDLPSPIVGEIVMPFNTFSDGHYEASGPQGVRVVWRDSYFGEQAIKKNVAGQRTPADAEDTPNAEEDAEHSEKEVGPSEAAATATGDAMVKGDGAIAESTKIEAPQSIDAATGTAASAATSAAATAASTSAASTPAASTSAASTPAATAAGASTAATAATATAAASPPVANKTEAEAAAPEAPSETDSSATRSPEKSSDVLRGLSAQDLRELANLEDAKSQGKISQSEYEARRNQLLQGGN